MTPHDLSSPETFVEGEPVHGSVPGSAEESPVYGRKQPEKLTNAAFRDIATARVGDEFDTEHGAKVTDAKSRAARIKRVSAAKTALEAFMVANCIGDGHLVGPELTGPDYDQALRVLGDCAAFGTDKRKSAKAKPNSYLRKWAIEETRLRDAALDGETFAQRLKRCMQAAGVGSPGLSRALASAGFNVPATNLHKWVIESSRPSTSKNVAAVPAIERILGQTPGSLTSLLPVLPF